MDGLLIDLPYDLPTLPRNAADDAPTASRHYLDFFQHAKATERRYRRRDVVSVITDIVVTCTCVMIAVTAGSTWLLVGWLVIACVSSLWVRQRVLYAMARRRLWRLMESIALECVGVQARFHEVVSSPLAGPTGRRPTRAARRPAGARKPS